MITLLKRYLLNKFQNGSTASETATYIFIDFKNEIFNVMKWQRSFNQFLSRHLILSRYLILKFSNTCSECMLLFSEYVTLQFVASESEFSFVFYGITFTFSSTTNITQILQARKTNGIRQQRTLRNKQFNIHNKTGIKINAKHNVWLAFCRNTFTAS